LLLFPFLRLCKMCDFSRSLYIFTFFFTSLLILIFLLPFSLYFVLSLYSRFLRSRALQTRPTRSPDLRRATTTSRRGGSCGGRPAPDVMHACHQRCHRSTSSRSTRSSTTDRLQPCASSVWVCVCGGVCVGVCVCVCDNRPFTAMCVLRMSLLR
jgi:hypothetical protein